MKDEVAGKVEAKNSKRQPYPIFLCGWFFVFVSHFVGLEGVLTVQAGTNRVPPLISRHMPWVVDFASDRIE